MLGFYSPTPLAATFLLPGLFSPRHPPSCSFTHARAGSPSPHGCAQELLLMARLLPWRSSPRALRSALPSSLAAALPQLGSAQFGAHLSASQPSFPWRPSSFSLLHMAPSSNSTSPAAAPSLLPWCSPVEAPCRHPLFLLSLPAPSPKQQAPTASWCSRCSAWPRKLAVGTT